MEWIIIKSYTEVVMSLSSISWQVPNMVPTYHSHLWDLFSLEQYFTMGLSILISSDYHAQETPYQYEAFHNWISLWQKVSGISFKYPPLFSFFEKDDSSDLWEVATCLSALLWMMEWFHVPCAHRHWNCASLRLVAGGDGASKYLSSWSLLIQSEIGRSLFLAA